MDEAVLGAIEQLELRSLRWGFTDGALSEDEALDLAESLVGDPNEADAAIDRLLRGRLLVEVWAPGGERRIRSRFAETIRLLSRLRQIFPGKAWSSAPRLVSDFRVDTRKRRYPHRHLDPAEVFERASQGTQSASVRSLWQALTANPELRLSDFQEEASRRIFQSPGETGVIVTAGTGSGKTMAFYLPALAKIGEKIRAGQYWTKAIAVYPRVELLKDQFAETYRMARRLDPILRAAQRPLIIGAYFGSTPNAASVTDLVQRQWVRKGQDFICPWLPCPVCGGDLLWREADITAGRERLTCANFRCSGHIAEDEIILTRRRLRTSPPDVLFTTTEMLNQRLSDRGSRRLLGVGQQPHQRPLFALLDEVHTYVGTSGAQAALTLRRWRHASQAGATFVGLSATLREASQFFSDLTGLDQSRIFEASPQAFVEESAEYHVALRADPASQTSLLSTTIQTAMLLSRMLDPLENGKSAGRFGGRLFAFTDNLDVINRLYDSLRDAEALTIFGKPKPGGAKPLAELRRPLASGADVASREADGQNWRVAETIGRKLDEPLLIGRTAAEDAGVLSNADVVVATASLEVGYNDDRVGAVLQHKAPRDAASFLQRRGRAGRARGMRPLSVTVLADYGRDRVTFEAYEHLFDPQLPPQRLPVQNDYVLRMQATYALFDWLSEQAPASDWNWAWDVLSQPPRSNQPQQAMRETSKRLLVRLCEGDVGLIASLSQHLRQALGVDQAIVENLLWRPPRALLLEAIPTLTRRTARDWRLAHPTTADDKDLLTPYHPLPDFAARTLFSDLALPEVEIVTPPATVNHDEKRRPMPVASTLQQLAPGRVTRRFAFERGGLHHWSRLDPDQPHQILRVEDYAEQAEPVGMFTAQGEAFQVYRPWRIRLGIALKQEAGPTSNAWFDWRTQFIKQGEPVSAQLPARDPWRPHVRDIAFFLHSRRASVGVRRFAPSGEAVIRRLAGDRKITYDFVDAEGAPSAMGFEIEVDAFQLGLDLQEVERLLALPLPDEIEAECRLAFFRYRLLADEEMPADVDVFQRDWIHQVLIAAALAAAVEQSSDLASAALGLLEAADAAALLTQAMRAIFQSPDLADSGSEPDLDDDGDDDRGASAQEQSLSILLSRNDVIDRLRILASQLTSPPATLYADWKRETLIATLGEATLQACAALAPRHMSSDSLTMDIEEGSSPHIMISETTLGGAGVVQAIAERVTQDPRAFSLALEAALAPTDMELAAEGLEQFVQLACDDVVVRAAVQDLRLSTSHVDRDGRRAELYSLLSARGLELGHSLSVSLNSRLLTNTNDTGLDELLRDLLASWRALENRLGVSVSVREIAYVFALDPAYRPRIAALAGLTGAISAREAAQILANLLWPRGAEISQRALQSFNPYAKRRRSTHPRLARAIVNRVWRRISVLNEAWKRSLEEALALDATAVLYAPADELGRLRAALLEAALTPVNVGYLQFFPRVERIERIAGGFSATLVLQEQV